MDSIKNQKKLENTHRSIGQRIVKLRKALGLTQREFAGKIGINHAYLSRIEQGIQRIGMKTLERICETFSVDLSYFLVTENEKETLKKASNNQDLRKFVEEFYQLASNEQKIILEVLNMFIKKRIK